MEENKTINDLIIEELDFDKYKHKKDIINLLKEKDVYIAEREFRKRIQINNKMFSEGKVDFYIAHSCRGYKKTFNWEDIKKSIRDNRKRAITMLIECDRAEKQFQRRNNLKLEFEDEEEEMPKEPEYDEEAERINYEEERYVDYEIQHREKI